MSYQNGFASNKKSGQAEAERYTPPRYIRMARKIFGGVIDLDPASCQLAQQVVQATKYYTAEEDGLSRPWHGNVWLNPPYSKGLITAFIDKFCAEAVAGRITGAIILTNAGADTKWFHQFLSVCDTVYLTRGHVKFVDATGKDRLACTRFRRHRVRCFDGAGGGSWRDGSLPASSSLRLCA